MSPQIEKKQQNKINEATENLAKIMKTLEPYIRKPKEEPIKREEWVSGESTQIHTLPQIFPK